MQPLVSSRELADLLDRAGVVVLDVRWRLGGPSARADYDEAHLPDAVFVDLETALSAPPDARGRHPLPDADHFTAQMRAAGVRAESHVVCYDDGPGTSAARAWWLLRYYGHRHVQVLDGGYAGWVRDGRRTTSVVPDPSAGDFTADPGHLPLLTARDAEDLARTGVLLDARSAERYAGTQEPVDAVGGHIPGALSAPTTGNVDAEGRFLPADVLRERFEALGVTAHRGVGAYCGSGVTAAHEVLALDVAGYPAALYADSWSGWITDPRRPVATGDTPG